MALSHKSILHEFTQKQRLKTHPIYHSSNVDGLSMFTASVTINGQTFSSEGNFSKKKQAEQSAAKIACSELGLISKEDDTNQARGDCTDIHGMYSGVEVDKDIRPVLVVDDNLQSKTEDDCKNKKCTSFQKEEIKEAEKNIINEECNTTYSDNKNQSDFLKMMSPCKPLPNKTCKSLLNERVQKEHLNPPTYNTRHVENNGVNGFICELKFCDEIYQSSDVTSTKKAAENLAAKICLAAICSNYEQAEKSSNSITSIQEPLLISEKPCENIEASSGRLEIPREDNFIDFSFGYRSLLQEHLQQRGLATPKYTSMQNDDGLFVSFCEIEGTKLQSSTPRIRKKQSLQDVAREGLIHMGVKNPEQAFIIRSGNHLRQLKHAKRKLAGNKNIPTPSSTSSWIYKRQMCTEFIDESYSEENSFDYEENSVYNTSQNSESLAEDMDVNNKNGDDDNTNNYDHENHDVKAFNDPMAFWNSIQPTFNDIPLKKLLDLSVGEIWGEKNVFVVGNSCFSIAMKCANRTSEIFCLDEKKNVKLEPGAHIRGLISKYHLVGSQIYLKAECCSTVSYPVQPLPVLLSCGIVFVHYDSLSSEPIQIVLKRYLSSPAFIHVAAALSQWFRRYVSNRPIPLNIKSITKNIDLWLDEEVKILSNINQSSLKVMFSKMWQFKCSWLNILRHGIPNDLLNLQRQCQIEIERRKYRREENDDLNRRPWNLPKGNFCHRLLTTGIFLESDSACACREFKEETGINLKFTQIQSCPYVDIPYLEMENLNPHKGDFVRFYIYLHRALPKNFEKETVSSSLNNTDNSFQENSPNGNQQTTKNYNENTKTSTQTERRGTKRRREDDSNNCVGERSNKKTIVEDVMNGYPLEEQSSTVNGSNCGDVDFEPEPDTVRTTINEECTWQPIGMAMKNSMIFKRIYQTTEFQRFLEGL